MTREIKEELQLMLNWNLVMEAPILSGNMQSFIQLGGIDTNYAILIQAPFYDMKKWRKQGIIVHTGENKKGYEHYADWVNQAGGFGRHNRSEGWVNRVCNRCAEEIAQKYGGKVIKRLPE